jgi:hypothetical protein
MGQDYIVLPHFCIIKKEDLTGLCETVIDGNDYNRGDHDWQQRL